jgi:hypothetical protein
VPDNAYLDPSGKRWECVRGYRRAGASCDEIKVPANGYLTDSAFGPGWACDRGFKSRGETCETVQLPENAHLDRFGTGWECDRPYERRNDACVPPRR